ncbi:MAG: hypothetical protein M1360_03140 [Candidatus Marsarchaeota archaeon]|jgi:hypothetical protein|nr:hypothetical protein [Candidatus Marsarchaeota archaeon]MCL5418909.1 hypothetical protein [Candidatus Marsarchaeota archaeon]
MNMIQRFLYNVGKKSAYDESSRKQTVIKLNDNSYQIVWADEYDNWIKYLKDTGKLE